MNEKEIPVTYVLFSDEGHGFRRPENMLSFVAVAEAFVVRHGDFGKIIDVDRLELVLAVAEDTNYREVT